MSITKKPKSVSSEPAANAFIHGAPDAAAARSVSPPARKNKVQIAITIAPDLLATIDALAARKGLSRAAAISLACAELVERDSRN
ncbi:hypothetical protein [Caballeronia sp. NCTM5]|uniref:hypothetical protein n=1 Tax=Caballeronia sp. NCTM5 TaxID=2921755 RepID=UPI0020297D48|nr:hypothetical protein [Caballeronia sp. NCTM5]